MEEAYRYNALRAIWCEGKDEQVGLLPSDSISEVLCESIHLLNHNKF